MGLPRHQRGAALARADLYFALSECYKEPTEAFAADVASGALRCAVGSRLERLGLTVDVEPLQVPGTAEEVLAALRRAYYPLFVIPPRFVLPVESVFKEWSGEGGFLSGQRGLILGPPAGDMIRRYRERGLEVLEPLRHYPDHLALLLEYGGLLCASGEEAALAAFAAGHLDGWIEEFAGQVWALTASAFYRTVASVTVAFVRAERKRLGITAQEGTCDA